MRSIRAGHMLATPGDPVQGAVEIGISGDSIASVTPIDPAALTDAEAATLLMPALCDAHDHGRGLATLAFGAADQPLETWLPDLARHPRVDPYLNAVVAFGRLAESGVGAVNHCHNTQDGSRLLEEAEAVSRAARDVGIAVAFGWPFFDRNALVYGLVEDLVTLLPEADRPAARARATGFRSLERNMELFERARAFEHPFFTLQYHPVAPHWVLDTTMAAVAAASAADQRRVHIHLLETERQREWADRHYPQGILHFLDDVGLLSSRLTVAHAVWLRPDECALLARRGVTVSINPSSNLRLRSGSAPVCAMRAAGVSLAIGLDGMALDDDQDMLRELRLANLLFGREQQGVCGIGGPSLLEASMVTARRTIVGDDGGGRLAAGAPADLLSLDLGRILSDNLIPEPDLIALVVARACRRDVRELIVRGRSVVVDRRCSTVDLPLLEAELTKQARASYRATMPDDRAIQRMREAIGAYYTEGRHKS